MNTPQLYSLNYLMSSEIIIPGYSAWKDDLASSNMITWGDARHTMVKLWQIETALKHSATRENLVKFIIHTKDIGSQTLIDLET